MHALSIRPAVIMHDLHVARICAWIIAHIHTCTYNERVHSSSWNVCDGRRRCVNWTGWARALAHNKCNANQHFKAAHKHRCVYALEWHFTGRHFSHLINFRLVVFMFCARIWWAKLPRPLIKLVAILIRYIAKLLFYAFTKNENHMANLLFLHSSSERWGVGF
jgi:hypothetical protein